MIVYEFWLKEEFKSQAFKALYNSFAIGNKFVRKIDGGSVYPDLDVDGNPRPDAEQLTVAVAVYSVSKNEDTHWVQLMVDDNAPQSTITAIEAQINGVRDDEPFRKYVDNKDNYSPIETPKYFALDRVLRVRQRQKDGTLGRIEDVE